MPNDNAPSSPPLHARIDRNTHKIGLPVDPDGVFTLCIKGVWRNVATEGPDPTAVIVTCRVRLAKRNAEYRLTRDTNDAAPFELPEGTFLVEMELRDPSDHVDLRIAITPAKPRQLPPHWPPTIPRRARLATLPAA